MLEPKLAANWADFTMFASRRVQRFYAHAIAWFYTDTIPSRALLMIGLGVPAGTTLWMLAVSSILKRTQR
jgi:hypothetical protein